MSKFIKTVATLSFLVAGSGLALAGEAASHDGFAFQVQNAQIAAGAINSDEALTTASFARSNRVIVERAQAQTPAQRTLDERLTRETPSSK